MNTKSNTTMNIDANYRQFLYGICKSAAEGMTLGAIHPDLAKQNKLTSMMSGGFPKSVDVKAGINHMRDNLSKALTDSGINPKDMTKEKFIPILKDVMSDSFEAAGIKPKLDELTGGKNPVAHLIEKAKNSKPTAAQSKMILGAAPEALAQKAKDMSMFHLTGGMPGKLGPITGGFSLNEVFNRRGRK